MKYKDFIKELNKHLDEHYKGNVKLLTFVKDYDAKDIDLETKEVNPTLAKQMDVYLSVKRANDLVYIGPSSIYELEEGEALYRQTLLENTV